MGQNTSPPMRPVASKSWQECRRCDPRSSCVQHRQEATDYWAALKAWNEWHEEHGWPQEVAPEHEIVGILVPREALKLLYECAKDYDRRIPEGNGGDWAEFFRREFEERS